MATSPRRHAVTPGHIEYTRNMVTGSSTADLGLILVIRISALNGDNVEQDIDAMVCWMTNEPLTAGRKFTIKHTTKTAKAIIREVGCRLDINTLHRDLEASGLQLNDIGRIRLRTATPLLVEPYSRNRTTGSFILIDDATGNTVGAGMING